MHPAAKFQFERAVREYTRWRAVAEEERSPAAAWWWATTMAVRTEQQPMSTLLCHNLELPAGSPYAAGAALLIEAIAAQTELPWPDQFPRRAKPDDADDGATAAAQ